MKKYRILSGLLAAFALLVGCHAHEKNDSVRREAALRPLPDYLFIRYGDNTLQFPSGRADFDTLYHKMDSLLSTGKGKINILHIGGSHVQAGYLSHRLRMNFSTLGDSVMTARGVYSLSASCGRTLPKTTVSVLPEHGKVAGASSPTALIPSD